MALLTLALIALIAVAFAGFGTSAPGGGKADPRRAAPDLVEVRIERVDRSRAESDGESENQGGVADPESSASAERGPDPATLEPGTVRVRVVDASTGVGLDDVIVTLMSDERFARFAVDTLREGPKVVAVSPGTYRLSAFRPGFDGAEREAVVRVGEETDVGEIRLAPGSAVLEGRVRGPALLGQLVVELHGPGRRGCALCANGVCATCGYGAGHSERRVGVAEPFVFERLAAGDLQLWVRDSLGRVVHMEKVALDTAEQRWIDVAVTTVTVDVDVLDKQGKPMLGEWSENGVLWTAPVRFHFLQGSSCVAIAEAEAPDRAAQVDPEANDLQSAGGAGGSTTGDKRELELQALGARPKPSAKTSGPRVDVARSGGRSMWPRIVPTNPRTVPLRSVSVRPGRTRIEGVPMASDRIVVTCGPHFTIPEKLDLAVYSGEPVVVRFGARCGIDSKAVQKMGLVSCTACHQLPGSLQWLDSGRARRRSGP